MLSSTAISVNVTSAYEGANTGVYLDTAFYYSCNPDRYFHISKDVDTCYRVGYISHINAEPSASATSFSKNPYLILRSI